MSDGKRNGSAGGGGGAQVQREQISAGRIYFGLRAYLDTLCESERSTDRVEGLDRPEALRALSDAIDESVPLLLQASALARAEAIDLDRGRYAPVPDAESTTEIKRRAAAKEDSQPGRKRS